MAEVAYLAAPDVLALAHWFFQRLGYAQPVLRANGQALLESAVHRAQNAAYYAGADLIEQAAALTNGIALNHQFIDGNKRASWISCVVFLRLNGRPLPVAEYEPFAHQIIAMHELTDRALADPLLTDWLRSRLQSDESD